VTEPLPKFDRVVALKVSAAQSRRMKAAARKSGKRFSTWARERLIEAAERIMRSNGAGSGRLEAPSMPGSRA
jgi:predicted nucleotide-binding protein (sugar kinase/HSP70/actin superfamily)